MLLVDDIQFIAGKNATQDEFFHTFNALYESQKQIIVTCDRPIKEMKNLEDRIKTRLEWGLSADIQPPDTELRMAIIRKKAEEVNLKLPEEVVEFLAKRLSDNVRKIEGGVKKAIRFPLSFGRGNRPAACGTRGERPAPRRRTKERAHRKSHSRRMRQIQHFKRDDPRKKADEQYRHRTPCLHVRTQGSCRYDFQRHRRGFFLRSHFSHVRYAENRAGTRSRSRIFRRNRRADPRTERKKRRRCIYQFHKKTRPPAPFQKADLSTIFPQTACVQKCGKRPSFFSTFLKNFFHSPFNSACPVFFLL